MDPLRSNDNIAMGCRKVFESFLMVQQIPSRESCHSALDAIMIKCNEATECCVTMVQRQQVVGRKAHYITANKLALDTLFVKLINPPKLCNGWLPEMWSHCPSNHLNQCDMPNDDAVCCLRGTGVSPANFARQICIQGRTHPFNVVNNCRSHQLMYTCLSKC